MKKLLVLVVVLATAAGISVAIATASSAPIVISYAKTCNELTGHCAGTVNGVSIDMQVTGFRPTGAAAHLTMDERITVGGWWFTAQLDGDSSPAGFIVLNGIVTGSSDASLVGAQIHQRSNLVGVAGNETSWVGQLRLMPASA